MFLLRGEHLKRKAEVGIPHEWFADEAYQQDRGLTWQAFASSESFVLTNNASANGSILREHLTKYKEQLPSHEVRHLLAVPIRTQTKMLGVLRLVNKVEAPGRLAAKGFTRSEGQVLVSLCSTVALALHSTQRLRQFTVLQSLVQKTSGLQSEEEAVNAVCAVACEAVNGDQSGIVMFYEDGSVGRVVGQVVKAAAGESSLEARNPTTFPPIALSNYRAVTQIVESQKAIAILASTVRQADTTGAKAFSQVRYKVNSSCTACGRRHCYRHTWC